MKTSSLKIAKLLLISAAQFLLSVSLLQLLIVSVFWNYQGKCSYGFVDSTTTDCTKFQYFFNSWDSALLLSTIGIVILAIVFGYIAQNQIVRWQSSWRLPLVLVLAVVTAFAFLVLGHVYVVKVSELGAMLSPPKFYQPLTEQSAQ